MASSVCKSLQCLISTLTQAGGGGHLFRLTYSVALWGRRNTANKYHWHVWGVLPVSGPHGVCPHLACVISQSTLLRLQVVLQGNCLKWELGCVHFPGLSCSGSGSQVLLKGTDSVGSVFGALPRSEQLRRPAAWRVHSPEVGSASYHLPHPCRSVFWVYTSVPSQVCPASLLGN